MSQNIRRFKEVSVVLLVLFKYIIYPIITYHLFFLKQYIILLNDIDSSN